jgi:hypothetical protein
MFRKRLYLNLLFIGIVGFLSARLYAQEEEGEVIIISDRVGKEIDKEERDKFELFQEVKGFQSAVLFKMPENKYFLKIAYLDEQTGELKSLHSQQSEVSIKNIGYYIDHFEDLQTRKNQTIKTEFSLKPCTSFYIELLGKGFYSLNVDFRKNKSKAMSLGVQWVENTFIASFMVYHFRGETYRSELGGGLSGLITRDDGFSGIMIHGVLGYRYQINNGLLFRIDFTPFVGIPFLKTGHFVIMPWVGMSAGYSL